ncbi:MAG: DUF177 domain-containing protein [Gemmatimonadetes bacterium]|nr:DUF177 domain-containing protein [Gemmatimonadota bacterium]MYG16340.1 DUF177 domain-containing protein [Gemmatimonadota bacterium]
MRIAIEHLAEGLHPIHLEDTPAADFIPDEECRFASPVKVDGTLTVSENSLVLQADIAVSMTFSCGRCLEEVEEHISGEIATYYEKTDRAIPDGEELTESDDVEILDYGAKTIDISRRIAELVNLNIPMKPLCSEACKGLCPDCGTNLNVGACGCGTRMVDSRLHILKTLLKEE